MLLLQHWLMSLLACMPSCTSGMQSKFCVGGYHITKECVEKGAPASTATLASRSCCLGSGGAARARGTSPPSPRRAFGPPGRPGPADSSLFSRSSRAASKRGGDGNANGERMPHSQANSAYKLFCAKRFYYFKRVKSNQVPIKLCVGILRWCFWNLQFS